MPKQKARPRHKKSDVKRVREFFDPRVTQERIMKDCWRRAIVGDNADPVLSTSPFDVMLARGLLDQEDYDAGIWFQRLLRYRAGRCRLRGMLDDGRYSSHTAPEDPRRDAEYLALSHDPRVGRGDIDLLIGTIVYHEIPRWLTSVIHGRTLTREEQTERDSFLTAIVRIKTIWLEFARETEDTLRARCRAFSPPPFSLPF